MTKSTLVEELDNESAEWLETNHPALLDALRAELSTGKTPEQIRRLCLRHVGPQRDGLARRVEQAARALARTEAV